VKTTWEPLKEKPVLPRNEVTESDYGEEAECPHCEAKQSDSWEYEDHEKYHCDHCGQEFYVWREMICKYISQKADDHEALEKYQRDSFKWHMQEAAEREQAGGVE
jgi:hypothetical protein